MQRNSLCSYNSLTNPKNAKLRQNKLLLSVWQGYKCVAYFDLLPRNQTINSGIYCPQLVELTAAIKEQRPKLVNCKEVLFHHDCRPQLHDHLLKIVGTWMENDCTHPNVTLSPYRRIIIYFVAYKTL